MILYQPHGIMKLAFRDTCRNSQCLSNNILRRRIKRY